MKTILSSRRHHYVPRVSIFLITVALIAGIVGCAPATRYDLTISSTAGGSVTATVDEEETVIGQGETETTSDIPEGTDVDLVAEAEEGYRFVNWTGDVDTIADVEDATTTITMNGDCSITASFVAVYDLTISSTTGGSVTTPGEAGPYTYDEGTDVALVAEAEEGYRFVNWTGDVSTIADVNDATTTITMNGDYVITVNFEEPVIFADPNLEAVIRESIDIPEEPIYPSDLISLTFLPAWEKNIADLTGLEHATSLTSLILGFNQVSDISPLANLTNLTDLSLESNQISDISPLANLTNLTSLGLVDNQISDISPLTNLTNLTLLGLLHNQISDISPLVLNSGLGAGDEVWLQLNPLSWDSIHTYIPQLQARGVTVYH